MLPLPTGVRSLAEFGRIMKWGTGDEAARRRAVTITAEELKASGVTVDIAGTWRDFYLSVKAGDPRNPSAEGRAELMERAMELLIGDVL